MSAVERPTDGPDSEFRQPCVTRPDRVDRVLAYDGVRRPATAWYQEAA